MRNFILLIRRFWNIILFLILEVTCFSMISKSRSMQGMDIISSSNAVSGYVYKKQNDVVYYFQLRRMNDSLLRENARLRNVMAGKGNIDTFRDVIARIPVTIKDTTTVKDTSGGVRLTPTNTVKVIKYADYHYIPARVVNNSISSERANYITINRGAADGIRDKMAVVTTNGIVGRIDKVSEHFARVVSVLSDRKVSTKLADGTSNLITIWNPGAPEFVVTEKVPLHIKVKKGDSVYTTGYSFFPENVLIGTVAKIDTMKATNSKDLKIRLSTNFRNLQYVYVVEDKLADERRKLEAEQPPPTKK